MFYCQLQRKMIVDRDLQRHTEAAVGVKEVSNNYWNVEAAASKYGHKNDKI